MTKPIRAQRGYAFENDMVKHINTRLRWRAFRLGGSQIQLPDVVAVNNWKSGGIMVIMELKSSRGSISYIKKRQIDRMLHLAFNLRQYKEQLMVFAFRFHSKRKVKTYYFAANPYTDGLWGTDYKCYSDGRLYCKHQFGHWVRVLDTEWEPLWDITPKR